MPELPFICDLHVGVAHASNNSCQQLRGISAVSCEAAINKGQDVVLQQQQQRTSRKAAQCKPGRCLTASTCDCADEESSSPVKQLLEPATPAVKQDAMRGQALVLKQQGNTEAAEQLLSNLVHCKEQFAEVQHLAQADFGALLMDQGKPKVCFDLLYQVYLVLSNNIICKCLSKHKPGTKQTVGQSTLEDTPYDSIRTTLHG